MGPLRLLFLTRTIPPAEFLFKQTEGLFNLLSLHVMRFDYTRSEGQIVRAPVAAPVFDYQHRMFHLM